MSSDSQGDSDVGQRASFVSELSPGKLGARHRRRLECPECDHSLPPDGVTECDNCGAHLELRVVVRAPAVTG